MTMSCGEASEMLAAYALNALEGEEAAAVEEHLERCPTCRLALEQDQGMIQRLATSVSLVDPPPDLKGRLMSQVDVYEAARQPASGGGQPPRNRGGWRDWFGGHKWRLAFSLTSVIALFLVGWTVYQEIRVSDLQEQNTNLAGNVASLQVQNTELASNMKQSWDAFSFIGSPNVQTVKLSGTDMAPDARGTVFVDTDENKALVMIINLPPLGQGEVYKLWMWRADRSQVDLGTFKQALKGYGMWQLQPAESLENHATWRLTVQPASTETTPSGQRLLDGRVVITPTPVASTTSFRPLPSPVAWVP